jgi:hypothetical protein
MIGRYTKVRGWLGDRCVTPPLMMDRRRGRGTRLYPCLERAAQYEWDAIKDQVARTAALKRREAYALYQGRPKPILAPMRLAGIWGKSELVAQMYYLVSGAVTTVALDSAYDPGVNNDAFFGRIFTPAAKTLSKVYVFISSFGGTAANVNDIDIELRPEASLGAILPNTGVLTEGKVLNPASTTGWHSTTGWTSVLAANARNYICVGDKDGGADHAVMGQRASGALTYDPQREHKLLAGLTTGGFASGNSVAGTTCAFMLLVFSDGTVCGQSISSSASASSSTNQRGLLISSTALDEAIDVYGWTWTNASVNLSGTKIYQGTAGPASGADNTSTDFLYVGSSATKNGGVPSGGGVYRFSPGTQYRLVVTYGSATTAGPNKASIGAGADADLRKGMPGGGGFTWTIESGGAWSDDADALSNMVLYLDANVAAAGGGNAQSLLGGRLVR